MTERNINYKKLCVRPYKNGFIYPLTIAKEREPLAIYISLGICLILFAIETWLSKSVYVTLMSYSSGIIFGIFVEFLYRLILITEESRHLISRYEGSWIILLRDAFYVNHLIIFILFTNIVYVVYYWSTIGFHINLSNLSLVVVLFLLGKTTKLEDSPLNDSLWVAKNNGLDYGSGMAYSFFHGYLNLVLPKTGTEDKYLKEIMQDYEDKNRIKFAIYKLIILIPKSMKCFVSLKNEYSPSIEESSSLEEKIITVAGVRDRSYKNAVYKIVSGEANKKKKYIYVSAEYATPLKTFKDVFDNRGVHSEYYNKHRKDIILQFYLTLGKVLDEKGLSNACELIYYEDCYQKDGVTSYYDVGEIIKERLRELKKKSD